MRTPKIKPSAAPPGLRAGKTNQCGAKQGARNYIPKKTHARHMTRA